MLLTDFPELHLQYDAELALLRVEWVGGDDMTRFRAGSLHLLQLARRLKLRHCLFDMDSLPDISAYDQIWMGIRWLPGVLKLPLARVVFMIEHSRVYHQATIDTLLQLASPFIRFDLQYFNDSESALCWLSNDSVRIPELLAEWEASRVLLDAAL